MIRAAADGRIDYRDADSRSPRWLLYEQLMLDVTETDQLNKFSELKHLQQAATAAWPAFDEEGKLWAQHYERGNEHVVDIGKRMFPYIDWDKDAHIKSEVESLREEYRRRFGDPSSPEAKAQAERDRMAIRKNKAATAQKAAAEAAATREREEKLRKLRESRNRRRNE